MRYINKQRYKGSCGPIAIANVFKWLDYSCSLGFIMNELKDSHDPIKGMNMETISNILTEYGVEYKLKKRCIDSVESIERCLDRGSAVLFSYRWYDKNGATSRHAIFINGHTKKFFKASNIGFGEKSKKIYVEYDRESNRLGHLPNFLWEIYKP